MKINYLKSKQTKAEVQKKSRKTKMNHVSNKSQKII